MTEDKIRRLQGPVLILGASGFIGASLFQKILRVRSDVFGVIFHVPAWRLADMPQANIFQADLLVDANLEHLFDQVGPKTIFDCTAYGAYPFETQADLVYQTNFNLAARLLQKFVQRGIACYIHAGSSSEYGDAARAPAEDVLSIPNSDYAVSKVAASQLIAYYGKKHKVPCANLRLYSVYGPLEDSSRLVPNLVRCGAQGGYPDLVNPNISRDFVYVDDACEAFLDAANNLKPSLYGESFNIGTGQKTTIADAAQIAGELFNVPEKPKFHAMPNRTWDVEDWYANPNKAKSELGWVSKVTFREGFQKTVDWYVSLGDKEKYLKSSKKFGVDSKHSLSAIVVVLDLGTSLRDLYEQLKQALEKLKVDYEIIFVDDGSTDGSEAIIADLSRQDGRITGISHSRNFGLQVAYRSGMEMASKNACVLMRGSRESLDAIPLFLEKWREGFDVVYGQWSTEKSPFYVRWATLFFYNVFNRFSQLAIPQFAGDFCLLDRRVVRSLLQFPERDFFLRGVRAYVGFRQTGIEIKRSPGQLEFQIKEFLVNLGRGKNGILAFSYAPLNFLSLSGVLLFIMAILIGIFQVGCRLFFPALVPHGITTVLLAILVFGAFNLFAMAILGEYIAKIYEEVKRRPWYLRRNVIRNGEVRAAATDSLNRP
jgi:dolichol-phosphate mannosyltransferase